MNLIHLLIELYIYRMTLMNKIQLLTLFYEKNDWWHSNDTDKFGSCSTGNTSCRNMGRKFTRDLFSRPVVLISLLNLQKKSYELRRPGEGERRFPPRQPQRLASVTSWFILILLLFIRRLAPTTFLSKSDIQRNGARSFVISSWAEQKYAIRYRGGSRRSSRIKRICFC